MKIYKQEDWKDFCCYKRACICRPPPPPTKIFKASIALENVLSSWKEGRVSFISKPGKRGYTAAKDFRLISLTFLILKTLEKLVERYVSDEVLLTSPLHRGKHAF